MVHLATSILPVPHDYQAGTTGKWLFTIWAGGFAILALPYCLYRWRRRGDSVAIAAWLGGWIVSLGEPMLDTIGHLWWPTNLPGPAFKAYDLSVPLLIPPCYVFFVAMTGYFAYRMFSRGVTVKQVFYVWLAIASTDLALELPGTAPHVYKYYGSQPFDVVGFPMHWAWMNGTGFLGVGFALWILAPRLRGAKRGLLVLAPTLGFLGAYGLTSWPAFLSINTAVSRPVMHLIDLGSLALCLLVVRAIAAVVGTDAAPLNLRPPAVADGLGEPERGAAMSQREHAVLVR